MKKTVFLSGLIFPFLMFSQSIMAQWTQINTPEYDPYNSNCVWQYYRSVGAHDRIYWAYMANCPAGGMGQFNEYEIFSSGNSGATWNSLMYVNSIDQGLGHLEFTSADTGCFVSGLFSSQEVFRTANALQSYEVCPSEGNFIKADLEMIGYNDIFVLDWDARFWRLDEDTLRIATELGLDLYTFNKPILCAATNEHIFIACKVKENGIYKNDLILRSQNGGNSWDTSYISETVFVNELRFATESKGFAVADNGIILKTEDGGESWEVKNSGVQANLMSIDYRDPMTWLIGAEGTMLITWDGGETWFPKYGPYGGGAVNVHFPEKDNIVYVSSSGLWKSDIDLLTGIAEPVPVSVCMDLIPNPARNQVQLILSEGIPDKVSVNIIDAYGKVIVHRQPVKNQQVLDCSMMEPGVYFVIVSSSGQRHCKKLVLY